MNKRYYEHTLSTTREFIEYLRLKNSASSLSLSGWWHISRMGFSSVEMCTGPVPLGGNLTTGFGSTVLFLLVAGIGICTGAIGGLEMIAWFMTL